MQLVSVNACLPVDACLCVTMCAFACDSVNACLRVACAPINLQAKDVLQALLSMDPRQMAGQRGSGSLSEVYTREKEAQVWCSMARLLGWG